MSSRTGRHKEGIRRSADMSVPADQRRHGRKSGGKRGRTGKGRVAQMDHGSSATARKRARDGERRMRAC